MIGVGNTLKYAAIAGALVSSLALTSAADAAVIQIVNIVASSQYDATFGPRNVMDDPAAYTDWAANNQPTGAYLMFDLGFAQALGVVNVTDRVTSGAGQGMFGGQTPDFTTSYTLQAYTDGTFTTTLGQAVTVTSATPAQPTSLSSFQSSANLAGVTAQFVEYTVNASNGNNPGLDNIIFNTVVVPEPASILALSLGLGVAWTIRRSRKAVA